MEKTLDKRERELALKLKSECDKDGKEKDPSKSARILHQLGLVYKERSPDMICLIQSAALFNAAIARKPHNASEIQKDLQALCDLVLRLADAEQKDSELVKKATNVKTAVNEMREKVKQSLRKLKPYHTKAKGLEKLEHEKIAAVKEVQNQITSNYKEIMASVSDYCVRVLGKAPCKFSQVGMGSMARSEITPYSDFENIIVLDEGCQEDEETYHGNILPYFRWYSVIFQLILINLQETILPSVGIPSLNDTTKKGGDWFFDAFTTRGISFDGMMPHACKSPLGRQQHTDKKPWKTELIKPVSEMVKYLDIEQDLKNGYHLSDILTKTCFVYGDRKIYEQFQNCVSRVLSLCDSNGLKRQIESQIREDMEHFSTKLCVSSLENDKRINFKRIVYRSTTLFIAALGRLHNVTVNSCFEVLENLERKNVLTNYANRKLSYAVSLACEVRLRLYMKSEGQNDWVDVFSEEDETTNSLIEVIGQPSCVEYFQIAYALQCDVCNQLSIKRAFFYSDLQLMNLKIYEFLGLKKEAAKCLKYCSANIFPVYELREFDSCLEILQKKNEAFKTTTKNCVENNFQQSNLLRIFNSLYERGKYSEAFEFGNKYLILSKANVQKAKFLGHRVNILEKIAFCLWKTHKIKEALQYWEQCLELRKQLSTNVETDMNIAIIFENIASCLVETREHTKALQYYEKSLQIKQYVSLAKDYDRNVADTFENIGSCFETIGEHEKAMGFYLKALLIYQRTSKSFGTDKTAASVLFDIGSCLETTNQYKMAKEFYEKCLRIYQSSSTAFCHNKAKAALLHNFASCLRATMQHNKAIDYYETCLSLEQKVSMDVDTDRDVATTFYSIGLCMEELGENLKAIDNYDKSLKIFQRKSIDADNNKTVVIILMRISSCLMELHKYKKAIEYYEKLLQINQSYSKSIANDRNVGITLFNIGFCLQQTRQYKDAVDYFVKSLQILQHISTNVGDGKNVTVTLRRICFCLKKLGKNETTVKQFLVE